MGDGRYASITQSGERPRQKPLEIGAARLSSTETERTGSQQQPRNCL